MDTVLGGIIRRRVDDDPSVEPAERALVLAAFAGDAAIEAVLDGRDEAPAPGDEAPGAAATGAYLESVTIEGFRGVGPAVTCDFRLGPGLTLLVGRNGSGKSSIAEGLELLLTGTTLRWQDRPVQWKTGFKNLPHGGKTLLRAKVHTDGQRGSTVIERALDDPTNPGSPTVQPHGAPKGGMSLLGWGDALTTYRPFLSYNELGAVLEEGPSKLYDALSSILGLGDLAEARDRLKNRRLELAGRGKQAADRLPALLRALSESADSRAGVVLKALGGRSHDLDAVELVLLGASDTDAGKQATESLRAIAALQLPAVEAVAAAATALDQAAAALKTLEGTDAARTGRQAGLLQQALDFHEQHGDTDCPVCGGASLDAAWRAGAKAELGHLRELSNTYAAAHQQATRARSSAAALLQPLPTVLAGQPPDGLDTAAARDAWSAWIDLRNTDDFAALAIELPVRHDQLSHLLEAARAQATQALLAREDSWRPIATDLHAWLPVAREARAVEPHIKALKSAENWITAADRAIRDERFAPIASQVLSIWERFREHSNVALEPPLLEGSGTRRKVELRVNVDGADAVALGVMSQGELHALALSLFLPRATMDASPFRFIVIDDPVQAMDPARVDGLARVLEDVASTRQVIVFTHDDRLPEAVRRLGIEAEVIEVTRRERSVVELRTALTPVHRYLEDARSLARTNDLPSDVANRVIPGFCRLAIDAACLEAIRRRRLARGESHADVERLLEREQTLNKRAALAFFDDPERGGDVLARLNRELGRSAGDAFQRCKQETHSPGTAGDLDDLIAQSAKIANKIASLA